MLVVGQTSLQPWHLYAGGLLAAALAALVIWRARQAYGLALAEALRAGQPHVFLSGPQPLGGVQRDAAAVAAVLAGMADPDPVVRRVSADMLGDVHTPAAVSAAVVALGDPDIQVRAAALRALGEAQAASAMLDVAALLADPEPEARRQAIETLRRLAGHSRALALHLRPLLADTDPAVRSQAAMAMLASRMVAPGSDRQAVETLMALTRSPALDERMLGINALAEWADPAAYPVAAANIADANPKVRCAALRAVAHIGGLRALALLIEALGDEAGLVRASAAVALAGLGQPGLSAISAALADRRLEAGALQALLSRRCARQRRHWWSTAGPKFRWACSTLPGGVRWPR